MKAHMAGIFAVGLVMGFAMTASAQTNIKASGQMYVYGAYVDNIGLKKEGDSRASIANRLRMQFEIQVQEGLKLTTRFDAMERVWGEQPAAPAPSPSGSSATMGATNTERNISWERAYVTFNALYGVFDVGYQQSRAWGTCAFCDDFDSDAGIHYRFLIGPWSVGLEYEKRADSGASGEGSRQGGYTVGGTDNDHDVYHLYAIYRWATGQAGLRYEFDRNATEGALTSPEYVSAFHELAPYVQWKTGPFDFEGELRYIWGKTDFDGSATDVDRKGYSLYLMGKYTMGAWYGGLEFAWISGDDVNTTDKDESGVPGGQTWDPMLMYGNYWFNKHHGNLGTSRDKTGVLSGPTIFAAGGSELNVVMFKPFVGWKVSPQLEIVAQYAWLKADETQNGWDDEYGKEFDIYATYKLYNNLSYTMGFGYFWTGDYFKQGPANVSIDDNYLIMNALNFTF